ncbi:hypothetical protein FKW77_007133 [Venturia effusa]|uniref:Peptidase A1 domain-containing protein n=1 Tax=Venturia effusa TaxID=50376 RepID=A0A517LP94_9PEZI|nr:hypothetical protein FKW77_007133 [Venturia effusa]
MPFISIVILSLTALSCAASRANQQNAIGGIEGKRFETTDQNLDASLTTRIRVLNTQHRGLKAELRWVKPTIAAGSDKVGEYILPLTVSLGVSPSQKYLNLLREKVDSINGTVATAPIKNVKDEIFMAAIQVGGQNFQAAIDTGSSDTWLMMKGYSCVKPPAWQETLNKLAGMPSCQFGPSYEKSPTFAQIADRHFNITYADGEYATGILGKDDVTLGDVTLKGQTLGFVSSLKWHGDGISSGNMGLGFPSITNAWNGTDPGKDKKGNNVPYAPIFTNLFRQKIIQPYFSIALNRAAEGPGMLALGGLPGPPIRHTGKFIRTPMQQLTLTADRPKPRSEDGFVDYTFYVVRPDNLLANSVPLSPDVSSLQLIVDSGSRFCHLPKKIVDGLMSQWKPKPKLNLVGEWEVGCDSTPPKLELEFNGSRISFDKKDLVIKLTGDICTSTIAYAPGGDGKAKGKWILGAPFFRSVVAVFDVGAAEMRFADRVR